MNKTGVRVYNINSQGSFRSSELLLNGSEQSYRQIGQSCSNRADIRLSLIRPHQRDTHSAAPLITAAARERCSSSWPLTDLVLLIWLRARRGSGLSGEAGGIQGNLVSAVHLDINKSPARGSGGGGVEEGRTGERAAKGKE